jgi:hypothetical protein
MLSAICLRKVVPITERPEKTRLSRKYVQNNVERKKEIRRKQKEQNK